MEEASVLFKHLTRGRGEGSLFRAKTGKGGWFEVGIPRGNYKLHVSKPLYKPVLEEGIPIPRTEPIQITLAEETGLVRLSGKVVDGSGRPVSQRYVDCETQVDAKANDLDRRRRLLWNDDPQG